MWFANVHYTESLICLEAFARKAVWANGILYDTAASTAKFWFGFGLGFVLFYFQGGDLQGQRAGMERWEDEWERGPYCKIHKESIKKIF